MTVIQAELIGDDTAQAGNLIGAGKAPIFDLCRKLIAAGANPDAQLECFRNGALALRVKSVSIGAGLTVRETATDGPRVVAWRPFPHRAVEPLVRSNDDPAPIPHPDSVAPEAA